MRKDNEPVYGFDKPRPLYWQLNPIRSDRVIPDSVIGKILSDVQDEPSPFFLNVDPAL